VTLSSNFFITLLYSSSPIFLAVAWHVHAPLFLFLLLLRKGKLIFSSLSPSFFLSSISFIIPQAGFSLIPLVGRCNYRKGPVAIVVVLQKLQWQQLVMYIDHVHHDDDDDDDEQHGCVASQSKMNCVSGKDTRYEYDFSALIIAAR